MLTKRAFLLVSITGSMQFQPRLIVSKETQSAVHQPSWTIKSSYKPCKENWNSMKSVSAYLNKNVFKPSWTLKRKFSRRTLMPWSLMNVQLTNLLATRCHRVRSRLWNMWPINCLTKTANFWVNIRLLNLATQLITRFKSFKKRLRVFSRQSNHLVIPISVLTMIFKGVLSVEIAHVEGQL